jgi:opacity protein-like surface antigen
MNSLIKKSALGGLLIGALPLIHAAPSIAIGDDVSVFLTGKASVEGQSNIYQSIDNEVSDTVFVLTPGLEVVSGGVGSASWQLSAGYEIRSHSNENDLDTELLRTAFGSLYDTGVVILRTYAGYNEFGTNSQIIDGNDTDNAVVAERSDVTAGASVKYRFTEQMSLGGGIDFLQRDWTDRFGTQPSYLTGSESLSVPVRVFFAVAPELDAFVGYRHRKVSAYDVDPSQLNVVPDYTDSYYYAGIEGQIFNPLWTVNLDVGFQEREYDSQDMAVDGRTTDGLTFTARVNYEADVNRSYYAILSRDYGQSTTRAISFERTRFTVGGENRITEMWSAFYGLTLAQSDYDQDPDPRFAGEKARVEHITSAQAGINYVPNEYVTVSASYQYLDRNNDNAFINGLPNPGFSNSIWKLSATMRY